MKSKKHYSNSDKNFILFFVNWWKNDKPIIIIGFASFILGLIGSIPGNLYLLVPKWINDIHVNLSTEMLSISFSILIIDGYNFHKKFNYQKHELKILLERYSKHHMSLDSIIENYFIPNDNTCKILISEFRSSLARGDYKILHGKQFENFVNELIDIIDLLYEDISRFIFIIDDELLIKQLNSLLTNVIFLRNDLKYGLHNNNNNNSNHLPYSLRMFLMKFIEMQDNIHITLRKYSLAKNE